MRQNTASKGSAAAWLPGALLWAEAGVLTALPLLGPERMLWLLPAGGFCALFAGLMSRGLGLGLAWGLGAAGVFFWKWPGLAADLPPPETALGVGALLVGTLLSFLRVLEGLGRERGLRDCASRLVTGAHFAAGGMLLACGYLGRGWQGWLGLAFATMTCLLGADCLVRLTGRMYTPRRFWGTLAAPGAFFFYRWLGVDWRRCLPAAPAGEDEFSLKLAEMWMWPVVRRALPGMAAGAAALCWLGSSLHEVPAGAQGVRQHLGRWEAAGLPPGLHATLPWPFGQMEVVETDRLREIVLGFQSDPGQPILWERAHYVDEQKSMVGGGDDLLSISVPVQYRVADPVLHLKAAAGEEAEVMLRRLAERTLLRLTVGRTAREIMTTAREELRQKLHRGLQAELDARASGLALAEVYLRDIHPPVSVAPSFQEVVAAVEEKEAYLHEGESYARDNLEQARGGAHAMVVNAEAASANRLLAARGQAHRFASQQAAWQAAPDLYALREGYRVLDETLAGAKKAVFDQTMQASLPAHLDLRKVLNPDLVDMGPPKAQTLVPRPGVSRDAFDLDIEGYLTMDRGEVPAVNVAPEDEDNLLRAQQPPPANKP